MGSLTSFVLIVVSFTLFCGLSAGPGDLEDWDLIPSNHALASDGIRAALFASTHVPDVSFERVLHPAQGALHQFQLPFPGRYRWYRVWFIVRNILNGQKSRCRAWVDWDPITDVKQLVEVNSNWTSRCWPWGLPIMPFIRAPGRSAFHRKKPVLANIKKVRRKHL